MDLKKIILKHSLLNAQQYGKAELGSVLGKVIAEAPESKRDIDGLKKQILSVIADVSKMKKEAVEKELKKLSKRFLKSRILPMALKSLKTWI